VTATETQVTPGAGIAVPPGQRDLEREVPGDADDPAVDGVTGQQEPIRLEQRAEVRHVLGGVGDAERAAVGGEDGGKVINARPTDVHGHSRKCGCSVP
jgi:hypothetical protein